MQGPVNGVGSASVDEAAVWGTPAFIERDQFVYYVTMAHELSDPSDWPAFRRELVAALTAAWGLDTRWTDLDPAAQHSEVAVRQRRAFVLVDQVRAGHDPVADWDGFFDALWDARGPLRTR